jgi:hypothetical protein
MVNKPFQYITVVETRTFLSDVSRYMTKEDREGFVTFIAANPLRGDLIPGTGGLRKVRWAVKGKGKSGGMRVIYYFHSERMPLFLFTAYGKSMKSDLAEAEKVVMRRLIQQLKDQFLG